MRKHFNGLYGLVRDHLGCDPASGHVFLFTNARRNRLKLLVYDGSGLWICAKKLDRGCFRWPDADSMVKKIVLSHEELTLLLGGIDLRHTERRRWYRMNDTSRVGYASLCAQIAEKATTDCPGPTPPGHT